MKTVFKLMAFNIAINIAIALVLAAVPGVFVGNTAGISQVNSSYYGPLLGMEADVTGGGELEDASSGIDRILDLLSVGLIAKIGNAITTFMWGWVDIIEAITQPYFESTLQDAVFTGLKTLITFAYIIGLFVLWTGRSLDD